MFTNTRSDIYIYVHTYIIHVVYCSFLLFVSVVKDCHHLHSSECGSDCSSFRISFSFPPPYLSALSAVRVNTETPTEVSWITGIILQATVPKIHSS